MELEEREAGKDLVATVELFEKARRQEKAARMKYAFQLNSRLEVLEMAVYEEDVAKRQSEEKEKANRAGGEKGVIWSKSDWS